MIQASTQQILGTAMVQMGAVSPGIFQCPHSAAALRQACIINEDGSLNSFTNPAQRGHVIQIFGTGQGIVSNAPADGTPAAGLVPSSIPLRVNINGYFTDDGHFGYRLLPGDPPNGQFVQYSASLRVFGGLAAQCTNPHGCDAGQHAPPAGIPE